MFPSQCVRSAISSTDRMRQQMAGNVCYYENLMSASEGGPEQNDVPISAQNVHPNPARLGCNFALSQMHKLASIQTLGSPESDPGRGLLCTAPGCAHSVPQRRTSTYPKMTAFQIMMLLSVGAALTPCGGSSWSLWHKGTERHCQHRDSLP